MCRCRQGSQGADETDGDHRGHGDGDRQDQPRDADDRALVGGGEVEAHGLPAEGAQIEPRSGRDVRVQLGAARVLDTVLCPPAATEQTAGVLGRGGEAGGDVDSDADQGVGRLPADGAEARNGQEGYVRATRQRRN